ASSTRIRFMRSRPTERTKMRHCTLLFIALVTAVPALAQEGPTPPITGRWDLTVHMKDYNAPAWLEVTGSGRETLVGRFVGAFGSVRPIGQVFFDRGDVHFSL